MTFLLEYMILGLSFMSALMTISDSMHLLSLIPRLRIDDEHRSISPQSYPVLSVPQLVLLVTPTEYDSVRQNLQEYLLADNFEIVENESKTLSE